MVVIKNYDCVDAGGEYCPCYLAEVGECILCSHLQNKKICECIWTGQCIYQNYIWNHNKRKNERKDFQAQVLDKKNIMEDIFLLKIKLDKKIVKDLKHPGSYLMLKPKDSPEYFSAPMSIMDTDENESCIYTLIEILGSKSKTLSNIEENIIVRGPYFNGLIGLKKLKKAKANKILVVGRGAGIAPAINTIKYLIRNHNKITFIVDYGRRKEEYMEEYIKNLNCTIKKMNLKDEKEMDMLRDMAKEGYDILYSSGSDNFSRRMYPIARKHKMDFVILNNSKICCGEGICGSCTSKDVHGNLVKMCKTQVKPQEIMKRGMPYE
jgi:NAD(P)H-flavin reductase